MSTHNLRFYGTDKIKFSTMITQITQLDEATAFTLFCSVLCYKDQQEMC